MTYQWQDYTSADAPVAESFLDPVARRFTGCEEGWEDYCAYWLHEPETRPGENFWVKLIRLAGEPVAVMALFWGDGALLVSEYILSPAMRGRGHGSAILRELLANGEEIVGLAITRARAVIFPENQASIRAFERAGFGFASAHPDGDALYYVYERGIPATNKQPTPKSEVHHMKNAVYQLNSVTNIQMNSYIITTADGKVIAIDGGFRQDAENMLSFLRDVTGQAIPRVDAWFFSHAHLDHISCFNEIAEKHWDKLTVEHVYYNFPSVEYCMREGRGYDHAVEDFQRNLPVFADRVVTVYGFDTYDFGEAHIEILYSPNPEIRGNWVNNSSVVFMLTLGGKKILFLGDAGVEEGDRILALYAGTDKLKADYVQMAHHGQNGVTKRFYEAVAPTGCLWCAPDWLWNNDAGLGYNTHCFKTVEVRGWMEELGVKEHYILMNGTQTVEL